MAKTPNLCTLLRGSIPSGIWGVPGREARVQASLEVRVEDSWDKKGLSQRTREQNLCSDRLSIQENAYNQMLRKWTNERTVCVSEPREYKAGLPFTYVPRTFRWVTECRSGGFIFSNCTRVSRLLSLWLVPNGKLHAGIRLLEGIVTRGTRGENEKGNQGESRRC